MVKILVTPLSYRLSVTSTGLLNGTNIYMENYLRRFSHTAWDSRLRRTVLMRRYIHFNRKTDVLYLPRYDLDSFCKFLQLNNVSYEIENISLQMGKFVEINLLPHIKDRNEKQTDAINNLVYSTGHLRGLALNTGCLVGYTVISCNRAEKGFSIPLNMMFDQFNGSYRGSGRKWDLSIPTYVRSFNGSSIQLHKVKAVLYSGIKPVYRILLENGRYIVCTIDHEIMTTNGMIVSEKILGQLVMCDTLHATKSEKSNEKLMDVFTNISSNHPFSRLALHKPSGKMRSRIVIHRAIYEAFHLNNMTLEEYKDAWNNIEKYPNLKVIDPKEFHIHHKDGNHYNNHPNNLEALTPEEHRKGHEDNYKFNFNQGIPSYSKAISYEYCGEEPTYDIVCEEPYRNFVANGIVVHNSGKTYCAIRTIVALRRRAMISVVGLVEQWEKEFYNFTDLTPDDIYIIKGAQSMLKLLSQIDRNIHPKVILCSLGTLRNYVLDDETYENCPPFDELMDRLGVGVRVADEAHQNFWLSMMVDLRTNANINIALTATFDRTDHQVKLIFNQHYPAEIRYGENEFNRYIDMYSYGYTLGGVLLPMKAYTTTKGYNHSKFEDYLLRRAPTKLEYIYAMAYSPIIFSRYVNIRKKGQKLLIICSTVDMCKWFKKRLDQDLPPQDHLKVEIYISETNDSVLVDSDVIISTPGSAGTGTDIKNLKTMLMTYCTGSSVLNVQMPGRLRELPDGETPIFAYVWCRDIQAHYNYNEARKMIYTQRGKSFNEIILR